MAVPIAVGAWLGAKLDAAVGTSPWGLLGLIFLGMAIAAVGVWAIIKRFTEENPVTTSTERAREAGRRWDAEVRERERKRDEGEPQD